nr:DNA alkylation repair protein [Verrucomicrobiota bacterium]
ALAWSQENLHGAARNEAIASLVKSAAEKSLTTASELVADMDPGHAQNRACASIFETWFKKTEERSAAFEWLASLPDAEARRTALERVQWNWMLREPAAVREFISGSHGDLASPSMIHQVARHEATKNPENAMQWASSLPGERAASARAAVLEGWLSIRPEGAADYARELPAGPERTNAIRTISRGLVWQNIDQADAWLKSLPPADQKIVRQVFEDTNLPKETRAKLNAVRTP